MPEQQTFLSLITGSFATPAAENPTVAMIEGSRLPMNITTSTRVTSIVMCPQTHLAMPCAVPAPWGGLVLTVQSRTRFL